jgi:hypothetical protein
VGLYGGTLVSGHCIKNLPQGMTSAQRACGGMQLTTTFVAQKIMLFESKLISRAPYYIAKS